MKIDKNNWIQMFLGSTSIIFLIFGNITKEDPYFYIGLFFFAILAGYTIEHIYNIKKN